MSMFGWDFEVDSWSRFWRWNLSKLFVRTHDMTSRSYFGEMNSTLGSVVPLAMFVTYNFWSDSKNNMIFQRRCTTYLYLGLWKKHNYHVRSCFPSSFSGDWNVRNMKEAFLKHLSCWQPGNCKENFFQLKSTKNIKKSTNSSAKQRWHSTCWLVVSVFEPILYFCFCYIKPTIRAFVVTL